jgi:hypothetical protein
MTPADKRMLDLLDRWLASIELHMKYLDLDDASYRQVQPWPEHDRPARWILELAQQKALQLKTLCKAHIASNDASFAESLELMGFLANLVGVQNIKRFIPLADQSREQTIVPMPDSEVTQEAPKAAPADANDSATREMPKVSSNQRIQADTDNTREMPKLKPSTRKPAAPARTTADPAAKRATAKAATQTAEQVSVHAREIVVADAVRLLKWGREWHELTELIARMAERPGPSEIRRILRTQKSAIEAQLRS